MPKGKQFHSPALRYGFAIAVVISSLLLRYAMTPLLGVGYHYITVYPAIIVVATSAGWGPAILTSVLGALLAEYYFSPELALSDIPAISVVVFTGVMAGWLAQRLHDALAQSWEHSEALAQSQQRFSSFMEHLPGAAWIKDLDGKYVYTNPEADRIFSKSPQEILGSTDYELFGPAAAKHFQENDKWALNEGSIETIEVMRQADGIDHHSIVSKFTVPGPDGKPAYIGGAAFDITDRIRAQESLRESEEKFRMLAENAGAIIGIVQGERIIYSNPYSHRATGYSAEELSKIDIPKLIHPRYQQMMLERARRRQMGEPVESHYEFIMIRKNGEGRWLDFSPIMITYRGKPAIIGIAFDITDRKQAENYLRESEQRLALALESGQMGMWQWDIQSNSSVWNAKEYELLGLPVGTGRVETGLFFRYVHPDDLESLKEILENVIKSGSELDHEFRIILDDGRLRWLAAKARIIRDSQGQAMQMIGVNFDITERKLAQELNCFIKLWKA